MSNAKPRRQTDTSDLCKRFRALALEAAALGRKDGLEFIPFADPALPHFTKLDEAGRAHALGRLEQLVRIGNELHTSGGSLGDSKKVLWAFLRAAKMAPPSDLLDHVQSGDVIDIYGEHHQMIFANPMILDILSYSLEDLYCRPWTDIFGKDETVFETVVEVINGILGGKLRGVVDMSAMPECVTFEVDSPKLMRCVTKMRLLAPLFEQREPVAYVCVNRVRHVTYGA